MTLSKVLYICTYVFLIMYIIMFVPDAIYILCRNIRQKNGIKAVIHVEMSV